MLHRLRRRPSPATAIAGAALFVALSGTALAQSGIIISSPDQLGDRVVTERALDFRSVTGSKLADRAVNGVHMTNPHLRARVNKDGTHPPFGFDELDTKRLSIGRYQVTLSDFDLNGRTLKNCSITATPRIKATASFPMVAEASAGDSMIVTVFTSEIRPEGPRLADSAFDVTAAC